MHFRIAIPQFSGYDCIYILLDSSFGTFSRLGERRKKNLFKIKIKFLNKWTILLSAMFFFGKSYNWFLYFLNFQISITLASGRIFKSMMCNRWFEKRRHLVLMFIGTYSFYMLNIISFQARKLTENLGRAEIDSIYIYIWLFCLFLQGSEKTERSPFIIERICGIRSFKWFFLQKS